MNQIGDWWARHRDWRSKLDRPYKLLVVIGVVAVATVMLERLFMADDMRWLRDWLRGSTVFGDLLFPDTTHIDWKDRLNGVLLLLGLPVAFCLWHWRDRNTREQIENTRKDVNLKEFQEVQQRAAGALDEKLPEEAREQLQIAALHQLRGFLRGDYGESFKRPAFELLLAGHAAAIHRIGVPQVQAQLEGKSRNEIVQAAQALRAKLTAIDRTRMLIIRDEAAHIFGSGFPLDGRRFDMLNFAGMRFSEQLGLSGSDFFGANLSGAHLEGADLTRAHLEDARLSGAHLEGANLNGAHLKGARLIGAHLEGAYLRGAQLEGANLSWVRLEGANLRVVHLDSATHCHHARFNAETQFGDYLQGAWSDLTEAEREEVRAPWIARGMINVDAPQP